jgi:hypothetical protein
VLTSFGGLMELSINEQIKGILGYDVDVIQTADGKYVVEWFNFNFPPPPKGNTKEEALKLFFKHIQKETLDPGELYED